MAVLLSKPLLYINRYIVSIKWIDMVCSCLSTKNTKQAGSVVMLELITVGAWNACVHTQCLCKALCVTLDRCFRLCFLDVDADLYRNEQSESGMDMNTQLKSSDGSVVHVYFTCRLYCAHSAYTVHT